MASIRKRNNSYTVTAYCGYTSDGVQIKKTTTWKIPDGMTPKKAEQAAWKFANDFEREVLYGTIANSYNGKLSDFCKEYLEIHSIKLSPITYNYYTRIINDRIIPEFGHLKLQNITPTHVQKFINKLQKPDSAGKKLSASTVKRYFVVMQSLMKKAYQLGYIKLNPTESARLELPEIEECEIQAFSKEETEYLLSCLSEEPLIYQCLIHLAIATGARRGELVALQWEHIDFDNCIITIRQSAYKVKGKPISIKSTKTKDIRKLAIPQYLVEMLSDYKKQQREEQFALGIIQGNNGFIFTQMTGDIMYPTTPTLWFTKFQKRHDIPHHKFHSLRHTSATLLLSDGANIKTVAARLGHSQISTTNRYVHALETPDKRAAEMFGSIANNALKTSVI